MVKISLAKFCNFGGSVPETVQNRNRKMVVIVGSVYIPSIVK